MKKKIIVYWILGIFLLTTLTNVTALSVTEKNIIPDDQTVLDEGGPTLHTFTISPNPVQSGGWASIRMRATDPDNDEIVYYFENDSVNIGSLVYQSGEEYHTWVKIDDKPGTHEYRGYCIDLGDKKRSNIMTVDLVVTKRRSTSISFELLNQLFSKFPLLTRLLQLPIFN